MQKVLICVFSGTGNTTKIAERYVHEFTDAKTTIYHISCDNSNAPDPNDYDMVGFGYPIHGFNAPEIFYKFIKNLPKVTKLPAFIFKTSGEPLAVNNSSSQKSIHVLLKKGYDVLSERHYVMPYNMIFRHSVGMAKQMWVYAKPLVKIHVGEIISGKHEKVKKKIIKQLHTAVVRIEWPFAKVHGPAFKVDMKKCIGCQKCVKSCPTNNISFEDGKFKFHHKCTLCVKCSFCCPTNAISIGWLNGWKVNGDYKLEKLANDQSIPFPALKNESKKMQKVYSKYFEHADQLFEENDINLNDYLK